MSRRPHLLTPQTSLQEAVQLMQRYSYEGYPVVKNGREVVGLLTRRAVDKAASHRLVDTTAGSLMEGGQFSVSPDASLEQLQQVMASSGWGQVPVIDPASGEITGIVTRTDLLKTLFPMSSLPGDQNLAAKLETALPPARLALLKTVAAQARDQHMPIYIVGGFVRDLLLDRPGMDFDVVVEGDAGALGRALAAQFGGRTVSHSHFGTAKWHIAGARQTIVDGLGLSDAAALADLPESLDLISARSEFYAHPTALPTVERSSIKQDLHRRDFTINTLALRLDGRHFGELHDYWGGLSDLRQGVVRVLHSLSFIDDPTRLIRAARFEQRFGFMIEPRTLDLMKEALAMLKPVSGERLHHELDLIFAEKLAAAMMSRLHDLGILAAIDADLPWDEEIGRRFPLPDPAETDPQWGLPAQIGGASVQHALAYLVWLSRLPEKSFERVSQRLKLPGYLNAMLRKAGQLWQILPQMAAMPASQVVSILDEIPLGSIYAVYLLASTAELRRPLHTYAITWRHIHPYTTGDTLLARSLPPSPAFSAILNSLRTAWLDGAIHSRPEEEALLEDLLHQWNLAPGSNA
jgi:tRNA nucleotidyltransferase (CCA-adding enzyme)